MSNRIYRIFIIQVVAFNLAILVISYLMFHQIAVDNMQQRVISNYKAELQILAAEINNKVQISKEKVKSLSSRTMIRRQLFSYVSGEVSLDELREYTQPKYREGASVYSNLLLARRTTRKGKVVAEYVKREFQLPETDSGQDIGFFKAGEEYHLYIHNEIAQNGQHIGYDTAVFDLSSAVNAESNFIRNIQISTERVVNTEISAYTFSYPVGELNCYVSAELNQSIVEREKNDINQSVLFLSLLLIAAITVLSYFTILRLTFSLIKERDQVNQQLNQSLQDKDNLLKELHHRVKNNLNLITSFIGLQSSESDSRELVERNDVLISRINAISLVHEKLQASDTFLDFDLGVYLRDLCQKIIESNRNGEVSLSADIQEQIIVSSDKAITVGLIFSELTINSLKHALGRDELKIFISLSARNNEMLLTYSDSGTPFPADFDLKTADSLGLMVIVGLVERLDGRIEYDFSETKQITIILPTP
ncbi:MAG: sensor histidine kinase [Spirochaetota bacterium]